MMQLPFSNNENRPDLSVQTWRQVLEQWKLQNRHLAVDALRKYGQMATMMDVWRPNMRPAMFDEDAEQDYLNHLLDHERRDAAIKGHSTGIRRMLKPLYVCRSANGFSIRRRTPRNWIWRLLGYSV